VTLHPDAQRFLGVIADVGAPPLASVTPDEARQAAPFFVDLIGPGPEVAAVRDIEIPGPAGPIHARVYEPVPDPVGTVVYYHGGGWVLGSLDEFDAVCQALAVASGARVVSVDYRLAPEHPFPACIDDCLAVAGALVEGGDASLLIGGESAGAHLSALVLTRLRTGFAGANLVYGCYDLGLTEWARSWGERCIILSTPIVQWHADQLLPGLDADARRDPSISPLFADLTGMPPALLTTGPDDPLYHDSVELAARWPGARLDVYPGGFHAFDFFDLDLARIAVGRQIEFLRDCLDTVP
jgi:acetyl esterase/lipase